MGSGSWWVCVAFLAAVMAGRGSAEGAAWKPVEGRLMTRWAREVSPDKVHPEYPRPQMVRADWLNLNGLWQYAIAPTNTARPDRWDGEILVPFPVESALSGVAREVGPEKRLWYRREFVVPEAWAGRRVRLNFGAVDWEAKVWINGREAGGHRGGYTGFTVDMTEHLNAGAGVKQELVVAVWDPSDAGTQPRGKQVRKPGGIWYTPTTGIWQTVWAEPVAVSFIERLEIVPDLDRGAVLVRTIGVGRSGVTSEALVEALVDGKVVASGRRTFDQVVPTESTPIRPEVTLTLPEPRAWSPDAPFLYDLRVTLFLGGREVDRVTGYFGLRKIAKAKDAQGVNRLMLNNQPLFQFGPLDQGFWPDGLYTAPTDEALRYDIEVTRRLGFNMARKHVKVEPDRWYYWCDRLGLLVWQDMPSGDKYIGDRDPDINRTKESGEQFEAELDALVRDFGNHPSIVMWVPYNEGWGQWDTARIAERVKRLDPTRLVNSVSGWTDRRVGDVHDIHVYPGPGAPRKEADRAGVLGEFGGLGLPVKGHTWQDERNWGYRSYTTSAELTDAYVALIRRLRPMTGDDGLSAAVYTQTTDVEVEVNGLMTYDRAIVKMEEATITAANKSVYAPPPARVAQGGGLVPPSTPLVAGDPYFSIWSPADRLTDEDTVHWTGRPHRLAGLIRVDGKAYRILGASPATVPALPQTGLVVLPTRTLYTFAGAGVEAVLTFQNPSLPDDLDLLARPVTYATTVVKSTDGRDHRVEVLLAAGGEITVNEGNQPVVAEREDTADLSVLRMGSKAQPVLARKGDDVRIDWGYLYLAAPKSGTAGAGVGSRGAAFAAFAAEGGTALPSVSAPSGAQPGEQVSAFLALDLGKVGAAPSSRWAMFAYDDLYAIQYMRKNLRPYWRRNGWNASDLLAASAREYASIVERCAAFDAELMADLERVGGAKYARMAALAYRQCFAASKFVADAKGQPLSFSKENFSNGCIGTSDVFYPMAPQFLLFGPSLAKSFLVPFMDYAASDRWRFPFAPHDLGTYPHANGQVYGGGERTEENQMPVEESGNLLILLAAVAQMEGNADFAGRYWARVVQWAEYLKAKGFDPENQLCTDDFAGHLAHNVNLSAKAICGLGAFGKLCALRGDTARAEEYGKIAREFAARWMKEADDGNQYRLAFDRPGSWSQKYNLVWDRLLGLDLFPGSVLKKEMAHYRKIQGTYGLPLDNRATYTKLDWIVWTATLTGSRDDFEALVDPVYRWLNETPSRVPMCDWYETGTGRQVGFQARPVVGGVYLPALYHADLWKKYASRDRTRAADWAPMPKPPKITTVVPTAREQKVGWRYTTQRPARDWAEPGFDASNWAEGRGGFGTRGTPGSEIGTEWNTSDIWIRRSFALPEGARPGDLQLMLHHDEDAQVYLNGRLILDVKGFTSDYEPVPLHAEAVAALKPGANVLAIRCHQTGGGQYIDAGLVTVEPVE